MQYQCEAERRVRIGVVGIGSHCYRNILPSLTYLPVELVAIADINQHRTTLVARQYGCRCYTSAVDMYSAEKLEAVLLCVSAQRHPELAIAAFKAGLHVWMEKPAALRTAYIAPMIVARGDLACVVGYKKAFMPATRKAIELLADQENVPLRSLLGVYPCSLPEDGPAALATEANTEWLANGCHPLSMLLILAGPAVSVAVHKTLHGGGVCILRHKNGALSNLHLAKGVPMSQPFERYLIVCGNHSIEIENTRRITYQRGIPFAYESVTSFVAPGLNHGAVVWEAQDGLNTLENKAVVTQGIVGGLDHFVTSVLNRTPPTICTLEFAQHLSAVWEAVQLSDENRVELSDTGWG